MVINTMAVRQMRTPAHWRREIRLPQDEVRQDHGRHRIEGGQHRRHVEPHELPGQEIEYVSACIEHPGKQGGRVGSQPRQRHAINKKHQQRHAQGHDARDQQGREDLAGLDLTQQDEEGAEAHPGQTGQQKSLPGNLFPGGHRARHQPDADQREREACQSGRRLQTLGDGRESDRQRRADDRGRRRERWPRDPLRGRDRGPRSLPRRMPRPAPPTDCPRRWERLSRQEDTDHQDDDAGERREREDVELIAATGREPAGEVAAAPDGGRGQRKRTPRIPAEGNIHYRPGSSRFSRMRLARACISASERSRILPPTRNASSCWRSNGTPAGNGAMCQWT